MPELDAIAAALRHFAEVEATGESALYAHLAARAAEDPDLVQLAAHRRRGQPVANMLFGAVQYLLAQEQSHPLRDHYPTLGGRGSGDDPFPAFRRFCLDRHDEIASLLDAKMVQTNEVRRSAGLFPAFAEIAARTSKPLTLVEIGPSAGLNLLFDRYFYDYGAGVTGGAAASPVRLLCESRGAPPPVALVPRVVSRTGIDLNPLDVRDDEAMRWLRALVWPEHVDRLELLNAAIDVAREDPPQLLGGNVFELLPPLIRDAGTESAVCVFATFVLNQFTEEMRERLRRLLLDASAEREVWFLVMGYSEFVTRQPEAPFEGSLWLVRLVGRRGNATRLGNFHHHGRWIRWAKQEHALAW